MKNDFINSWNSKKKQNDKINVELRFGKFTLLLINIDFSKKSFDFLVFNLGAKIIW